MTEVGQNKRRRRAAALHKTPENTEVSSAFSKPASKAKKKSSVLSIAVVAFIVPGLFATVALPAYAYQTPESTEGQEANAAIRELKENGAQSVEVAADVALASTARDAFGATTHEEIAAAAQALAAEQERAALAASYASYSGPGISDYLANPPYPSFSLDAVVSVAMQYQGVPYVYGGSDPSGFDCSGFVSFVYAQFGIALPHSVTGIAASGTRIATADALPGDIVTMAGHNGIYLGNGTFIDAPKPGGVVSVRPIWTSDYYIVRLGI